MVVTRLDVSDFPFVRYGMRDIADVEFVRDENGQERFLITKIEGKDSNFIMSDQGKTFYPSFWNDFVNQLNIQLENAVIEIKVYERQQEELEIQYILSDSAWCQRVEDLSLTLLNERMSSTMRYNIKFVDFIDHDYRRKYRVIERIGDVEFAGGMVGDNEKSETVQQIEAQAN